MCTRGIKNLHNVATGGNYKYTYIIIYNGIKHLHNVQVHGIKILHAL